MESMSSSVGAREGQMRGQVGERYCERRPDMRARRGRKEAPEAGGLGSVDFLVARIRRDGAGDRHSGCPFDSPAGPP